MNCSRIWYRLFPSGRNRLGPIIKYGAPEFLEDCGAEGNFVALFSGGAKAMDGEIMAVTTKRFMH